MKNYILSYRHFQRRHMSYHKTNCTLVVAIIMHEITSLFIQLPILTHTQCQIDLDSLLFRTKDEKRK